MIVVLSDTHREERPGLTGPLREAVRDADRVLHAGDFTTTAVLDGFESIARSLTAVHGNSDTPAVKTRLPAARTLSVGSIRIALTHTQRGGEVGLRYFGEERNADLVVSGHTHRPHLKRAGSVTLLNPGSHSKPRGRTATYAILEPTNRGLRGEIRTTGGDLERGFEVEGRSRTDAEE